MLSELFCRFIQESAATVMVRAVLERLLQGFEGGLDQGFQGVMPAWVFLSVLRCANSWATDT